ncbi:hypothetical protein [Streptosporangium roseum]|uniref:hypothetical protein n=1 Tax=Streptosporangium roseum TaxID=2001 RepID=UPI003316AC98
MQVEDHLSTNAMADFAVDMSNVVREGDLGGERRSDLSRFTKLVEGLITYAKDHSLRVYGVADRSLLQDRFLTDDERSTLRRWYQRGLIEVLDVADDRLVELADGTGMKVVTRDNYLEYHRPYPWLSGNRDLFLRHVAGPGGTVTVRPRVMPIPRESEISRKEEEGILLSRGMIDRTSRGRRPRTDLLTRRWRCAHEDCPLFGAERPHGQPLPVHRAGAVRCPTHHEPLTDLGYQPRRVQVKVSYDGEVLCRFVVEPDRETAVGRAPGGDGVALPAGPTNGISRRHVLLRWNGRELTVVDVSSYGIHIRPDRGAPFPLAKGGSRVLRRHESVVLSDRVELLVSGREYIIDDAPHPSQSRTEYLQASTEETRFPDEG